MNGFLYRRLKGTAAKKYDLLNSKDQNEGGNGHKKFNYVFDSKRNQRNYEITLEMLEIVAHLEQEI